MDRKLGTFYGVFTPTLLTILGVIMYVRLGWVVGNAGLLGAFAIMGLAMGITVCTGLSLSSIATNRRLGAGGPYAISEGQGITFDASGTDELFDSSVTYAWDLKGNGQFVDAPAGSDVGGNWN